MSRQQYGLSFSGTITEEVRKFLVQFRDNVSRGNAKLLYSSYTAFKSITEKTYQVSTWPLDLDVIKDLKLNISEEKTKIFLYLYRELFYRHAFDRCDITFEFMHDSFTNYMRLFNVLLQFYDGNKRFCEIPNVWLWDMINSFVSQFQYYHHWRSNNKDGYKNMNELLEKYKNKPQQKSIQEKWNVQNVLRYLHYFVHAAKIPIKNTNKKDNLLTKPTSIMMQMLGFFSLIGLCRIHVILCDYRTAINVMHAIDLKAKSAITKFASCCISAHYYLSFAYCMTRRFPDAHSLLCTLLRNPRYSEKLGKKNKQRFLLTEINNEGSGKGDKSKLGGGKESDQELSDKDRYHKQYLSNEAMLDRSWSMLAIANTQCPTKLDELLLAPLRDYFGSDMDDINDNSSSSDRIKQSYNKLFQSCAPDFINTYDPFKFKFEQLAKTKNIEMCNNQFNSFMRLTNKRHDMLKVKNEIKLFRVIPFNKLVKAMNYQQNEIGKLNRELIRLKWRMKQNKNIDSWGNTKDQFTFYVKDDCVYVQELQTSQLWKYSDYFIRNTQTVSDWIDNYPTHIM